MQKIQLVVWLGAALLIYIVTDDLEFGKFLVPLVVVSFFAFLITQHRIKYVEYLLFFSISIASLLGLTETLTGSHAESSNAFLYGLSFYTASMAYLIAKGKFNYGKILAVSNPLLLSTGPIALFLKRTTYRGFKKRFEYYFPFVIIGSFMFLVVGSPLTRFFFLIEATDVISATIFAVIFELFVYMNFCGLSLLIYGLFGLVGYRIPLNFNQPFSSRNIIEFWKGWHTSLSQVLKVLFYKPLRAKFSMLYALLGVFVSSAMWHGMTLNFLLWGTFHAFSFWLSIKLLRQKNTILPLILLPFIIVIGRLLFADSDTQRLLEKLTFAFDGFDGISALLKVSLHSLLALVFGVLLVAFEFVFRNSKVMRKRNYKFLRTPYALLILCCLGVLFVSNVGVDYAVYGQR